MAVTVFEDPAAASVRSHGWVQSRVMPLSTEKYIR
jgi:hypothetical protein